MNTENVVIEACTAVRATNKALCVKFADGVERWIPKSQVAASSQVQGAGSRGNLVVSQWWADNAKVFATGAAPGPRETPAAAATSTRRPQGKPLENKPGSGCMFHQRAEGKRPDWRGGVNIDGREYELVGWTRQSKSGREYLSLAIEPAPSPQASDSTADVAPMDDEDIPF
jgi:hypothetical protein